MQYDVKTPSEYLKALDDDWRKTKINLLRSMIREVVPELTEAINYKMLSYQDSGDAVFHLNAQKQYVSFYVGNISKIDPKGRWLQGLSQGKGCIRFNKASEVKKSVIGAFIAEAIRLRKEGSDIGC